MYGVYYTSAEAVVHAALLVSDGQTCLFEVFVFVSGVVCRVAQVVAAVNGISEAETLNHGIRDSSLPEVSQTDCASIVGIGKVLLEVIHGKFVYSKHLFAFRSLATFFFAFLPLLNFDVIFVSKPAQCLLIRHLLEFHKKIDRSTAFAATEAFANAFRF